MALSTCLTKVSCLLISIPLFFAYDFHWMFSLLSRISSPGSILFLPLIIIALLFSVFTAIFHFMNYFSRSSMVDIYLSLCWGFQRTMLLLYRLRIQLFQYSFSWLRWEVHFLLILYVQDHHMQLLHMLHNILFYYVCLFWFDLFANNSVCMRICCTKRRYWDNSFLLYYNSINKTKNIYLLTTVLLSLNSIHDKTTFS